MGDKTDFVRPGPNLRSIAMLGKEERHGWQAQLSNYKLANLKVLIFCC